MWAYDAQKSLWTELSPFKRPDAPGVALDGLRHETGAIVLYGGSPDPFAFKSDTWVYDSGRNTWSTV